MSCANVLVLEKESFVLLKTVAHGRFSLYIPVFESSKAMKSRSTIVAVEESSTVASQEERIGPRGEKLPKISKMAAIQQSW
jgi:hypothetical protein